MPPASPPSQRSKNMSEDSEDTFSLLSSFDSYRKKFDSVRRKSLGVDASHASKSSSRKSRRNSKLKIQDPPSYSLNKVSARNSVHYAIYRNSVVENESYPEESVPINKDSLDLPIIVVKNNYSPNVYKTIQESIKHILAHPGIYGTNLSDLFKYEIELIMQKWMETGLKTDFDVKLPDLDSSSNSSPNLRQSAYLMDNAFDLLLLQNKMGDKQHETFQEEISPPLPLLPSRKLHMSNSNISHLSSANNSTRSESIVDPNANPLSLGDYHYSRKWTFTSNYISSDNIPDSNRNSPENSIALPFFKKLSVSSVNGPFISDNSPPKTLTQGPPLKATIPSPAKVFNQSVWLIPDAWCSDDESYSLKSKLIEKSHLYDSLLEKFNSISEEAESLRTKLVETSGYLKSMTEKYECTELENIKLSLLLREREKIWSQGNNNEPALENQGNSESLNLFDQSKPIHAMESPALVKTTSLTGQLSSFVVKPLPIKDYQFNDSYNGSKPADTLNTSNNLSSSVGINEYEARVNSLKQHQGLFKELQSVRENIQALISNLSESSEWHHPENGSLLLRFLSDKTMGPFWQWYILLRRHRLAFGFTTFLDSDTILSMNPREDQVNSPTRSYASKCHFVSSIGGGSWNKSLVSILPLLRIMAFQEPKQHSQFTLGVPVDACSTLCWLSPFYLSLRRSRLNPRFGIQEQTVRMPMLTIVSLLIGLEIEDTSASALINQRQQENSGKNNIILDSNAIDNLLSTTNAAKQVNLNFEGSSSSLNCDKSFDEIMLHSHKYFSRSHENFLDRLFPVFINEERVKHSVESYDSWIPPNPLSNPSVLGSLPQTPRKVESTLSRTDVRMLLRVFWWWRYVQYMTSCESLLTAHHAAMDDESPNMHPEKNNESLNGMMRRTDSTKRSFRSSISSFRKNKTIGNYSLLSPFHLSNIENDGTSSFSKTFVPKTLFLSALVSFCAEIFPMSSPNSLLKEPSKHGKAKFLSSPQAVGSPMKGEKVSSSEKVLAADVKSSGLDENTVNSNDKKLTSPPAYFYPTMVIGRPYDISSWVSSEASTDRKKSSDFANSKRSSNKHFPHKSDEQKVIGMFGESLLREIVISEDAPALSLNMYDIANNTSNTNRRGGYSHLSSPSRQTDAVANRNSTSWLLQPFHEVLSPRAKELLWLIYLYTDEFKEVDAEFRLFYLVSHQLVPEAFAINFLATMESIFHSCEESVLSDLLDNSVSYPTLPSSSNSLPYCMDEASWNCWAESQLKKTVSKLREMLNTSHSYLFTSMASNLQTNLSPTSQSGPPSLSSQAVLENEMHPLIPTNIDYLKSFHSSLDSNSLGWIEISKFIEIIQKNALATFAISACGLPRDPIDPKFLELHDLKASATSSPPNSSKENLNILKEEKQTYPFSQLKTSLDIISHFPLTSHQQHQLLVALGLDQQIPFVNYHRLLFNVNSLTSYSHFMDEFLTILLDIFQAQQESWVQNVVLPACRGSHESLGKPSSESNLLELDNSSPKEEKNKIVPSKSFSKESVTQIKKRKNETKEKNETTDTEEKSDVKEMFSCQGTISFESLQGQVFSFLQNAYHYPANSNGRQVAQIVTAELFSAAESATSTQSIEFWEQFRDLALLIPAPSSPVTSFIDQHLSALGQKMNVTGYSKKVSNEKDTPAPDEVGSSTSDVKKAPKIVGMRDGGSHSSIELLPLIARLRLCFFIFSPFHEHAVSTEPVNSSGDSIFLPGKGNIDEYIFHVSSSACLGIKVSEMIHRSYYSSGVYGAYGYGEVLHELANSGPSESHNGPRNYSSGKILPEAPKPTKPIDRDDKALVIYKTPDTSRFQASHDKLPENTYCTVKYVLPALRSSFLHQVISSLSNTMPLSSHGVTESPVNTLGLSISSCLTTYKNYGRGILSSCLVKRDFMSSDLIPKCVCDIHWPFRLYFTPTVPFSNLTKSSESPLSLFTSSEILKYQSSDKNASAEVVKQLIRCFYWPKLLNLISDEEKKRLLSFCTLPTNDIQHPFRESLLYIQSLDISDITFFILKFLLNSYF